MYWGASLEMQYPFYFLPKDSGFRGAIFVDSGSVWGYKGETQYPATGEINGTVTSTTAGNRSFASAACNTPTRAMPRVSVGASLIWDSPFGPLRFDFAYPVLKQPYDRPAMVPVRRRHAVLIAAATLVNGGRMPDFFPVERELTIGEIVALTRAKPRAGTPLDRRIGNIAPLDTARASDISFLDNKKYLGQLAVTRAGACLLKPHFEDAAPDTLAVLVTAEPYRAFVAVARALFPGGVAAVLAVRRERPRGERATCMPRRGSRRA